jgi:hypothetical protein
MNEADLNDPLNWYVADSVDDYSARPDAETAKKIIHRNNSYPKLVQAVRNAISILETAGQIKAAEDLKRELRELGEPE